MRIRLIHFNRVIVVLLVLFAFAWIQVDMSQVNETAKTNVLNRLIPPADRIRMFQEDPEAFLKEDLLKLRHYYHKIVEYIPEIAEAYVLLGVIDYYLNEKASALTNLEKAYELNPRFIWVNYNLGLMYYQNQNYQEAKKHLQLVLNSNPQIQLKAMYKTKIYQQFLGEPKYFGDVIYTSLRNSYQLSQEYARKSAMLISAQQSEDIVDKKLPLNIY